MKLITEFDRVEEARAVQQQMIEAGVAVWLSGVDVRRLEPGLRVGLWVCVESQAADAERLLFDSDHTPAQPLPAEQIDDILAQLDEAGRHTRGPVLRLALLGLALLLGFVAVVWLIDRVVG